MHREYDVIIVGAGPAGSMAACAATQSGARVLLIDKRHELGTPIQCGEAVGEQVLRDVGLDPDSHWVVHRSHVTRLVSPSGLFIQMSEKKGSGKSACLLDRRAFDRHLAGLAVAAGADIQVGTLVEGLIIDGKKVCGVRTSGPAGRVEVRGLVTIAADGVMSRVARWAGIRTTLKPDGLESCVQFRMVGIDLESPDTSEFLLCNRIAPGGFVWIFPKGENLANVGLGVLPSHAKRPAIEYLREYVDSKPGLRKGKIIEIHAGGVPVSGPARQSIGDGLIAVGDAARHVHALTGGGLDYALKGGREAGLVAAGAVVDKDGSVRRLDEYQRRWKQMYEKSLKQYAKIKRVVNGLSDTNYDELMECVQGMSFGSISAREFVKVLIKRSPKLLWKLRGVI